MTDQPNSGSANPDSGASSPTPPPPPPPLAPLVQPQPAAAPPTGWAPAEGQAAAAPTPPPAPRAQGKLRTYITFGVIALIIAAVLYAVRNNASADDLVAGDCFYVPTQTEVSTVEKRACTEPHDAEVFIVSEMSGTTYPLESAFDDFTETTCIPAFASYVGRTFEEAEELNYGFFYPTPDGWNGGDRKVTCYIVRVDETKMSQSVKAAS